MTGVAARQAGAAVWEPGRLLVLGATCFNLVLCFVNTAGWLKVGNQVVAGCELLIICCGLYLVRHRIAVSYGVLLLIALYAIAMKLLNLDLDLKILHDLIIMYVFYLVGLRSSRASVSVTLWTLVIIVLAVGSIELWLTDLFGQFLNVWSYYVDKGAIASDVVNYGNSSLFLSATRGQEMGRTFFPSLFGAHRVSSIFLEPDSMGNFAAILFAWGLSARFATLNRRLLLLGVAILCVVLADSRFASGCCLVMLAVRHPLFHRSRLVVFLLPLIVMAALMGYGAIYEIPDFVPTITSDDLPGRLLFSGRLLDYWNLGEWMGLQASRVYTADTGYAYMINNLGIFPTLLLLGAFATRVPITQSAQIFKAMMSVYFSLALCIGASVFTIKTAALLWFLYGAASAVWREAESEGVKYGTGSRSQVLGSSGRLWQETS